MEDRKIFMEKLRTRFLYVKKTPRHSKYYRTLRMIEGKDFYDLEEAESRLFVMPKYGWKVPSNSLFRRLMYRIRCIQKNFHRRYIIICRKCWAVCKRLWARLSRRNARRNLHQKKLS